MNAKTEQDYQLTSINGKETNSQVPSEQSSFLWTAANFLTVSTVTSLGIVSVQSPLKTMLANSIKNGTMFPAYTGGTFGLIRALYAATFTSFTGSMTRTAYVTCAKKNNPEIIEIHSEENSSNEARQAQKHEENLTKAGYVMAVAFGDTLVTQIPETKSQLEKVNIKVKVLPDNLKGLLNWNNVCHLTKNNYKLMNNALVPRYLSGLGNFASLCVLEEGIAHNLPIENKEAKHFVAGALSGMSAAVITYPLTTLKDNITLQASLNENGELQTKGTLPVLKNLGQRFYQNPGQSMFTFGSNAVKQLPVRMVMSGLVFSMVSGIGSTLGDEPLKKAIPEKLQSLVGQNRQSFFGKVNSPRIEEVVEVTAENTSVNQNGI